ncbi:IS1/IS1595 family N-terminal zinc-binding domain-containing protein [Synechocystis sp. PCC 7509]|nr:IS1 family transposase [Synechocystis sp. PCC 7509]
MTVWLAVHCPHCQSTEVKKHGTSSNGKRRYSCLNRPLAKVSDKIIEK